MLSLEKFRLASKDLNRIALPLIIQNMTSVIIVATDKAIIGRVSPEAFNAVGVVGALLSLLAGIFGYISVQFNIAGGKASIKENGSSELADEFTSAIFLNVIIGIFFFVTLLLFSRPLFAVLYGFEGYMLDAAVAYASIMSIYLLLQLLLFSFGSLFKIKRNTKWILYVSLSVMGINLLLDFIFIIGMGFGVRAAAISNVIAKSIGLAIYVILCRKEIKISIDRFAIYGNKMVLTIKNSIPLMGQEVLEGSVFSLAVISVIARVGDYHLSAYLVLTLILSFIMMPVYMYGSAILTLVSQIDSKYEKEKYSLLPKVGLILSLAIFIAISVVFYIFRDLLPFAITNNDDVAKIASSFLIFMVIANIFEVVSTIYKYSLQVIGLSKFVLYRTAIINLVAAIILVVTTQVFRFELYGVFICLFVNYSVASLVYFFKYKTTIQTTHA